MELWHPCLVSDLFQALDADLRGERVTSVNCLPTAPLASLPTPALGSGAPEIWKLLGVPQLPCTQAWGVHPHCH